MLAKWLLLGAALSPLLLAQAGAPAGLRCEYLTDPLGVDVRQPRLSWVLEHSARGERQSAYQVLVSLHSEVTAGDVWDSGKVTGAEPVQVAYGGKALVSGQTYYWRVRFWDSQDRASPYSEVARFETGPFDAGDWKGRWIGGANQMRREFTLPERPLRARAYVAGLGYYELRINGHKVGDHVLDPAWTTYDKRVLYTVYDVTERLRKDYYIRRVMNPQRYQPGTKMPTYADSHEQTPFKNILGGDAHQQFEAIWQYLRAGKQIVPPE